MIAHRFSKAITHYDREAMPQHAIAAELISLLSNHIGEAPNIAEIGCGTGYFSHLLAKHFAPKRLWLNDICASLAPNFENWENTEFHAGDIEALSIPVGQNIIAACSVMQWIGNQQQFVSRCADSLAVGGLVAFSSFGPKNLQEVKSLTGVGLDYYSLVEYKQMLSKYFKVLSIKEQKMKFYFPDAMSVLRHLQRTGVTATRRFTWTRGSLADFCHTYEQRFTRLEGVSLTYHPIYMIARLKK